MLFLFLSLSQDFLRKKGNWDLIVENCSINEKG